METKIIVPYNKIVRLGLWIIVITATIWAAGHIIRCFEAYLTYALCVDFVIMAVGLIVKFRKNRTPVVEKMTNE